MTDPIRRFPASFLFGAATAAYQIEGSPLADGAGLSNWHRFAHTPGMTANGDTGDIAADHYRRWADDIELMRSLGLGGYRFSVSWSRVIPEGRGRVSSPGLGFYDRLVDGLVQAGIEPSLTLFHWDLPAALEDRGGWLNPDSAHWFAEYAAVIAKALGDRVTMWTTLNEPWVVADGGYFHGVLAPGHRSPFEAVIVARNLLRGHGVGVQALRAVGVGSVGLVVNLEPKYPASADPQDLAATARADAYMNRQFLDPVLRRESPEEMREVFGEAWTDPSAADLDLIAQPIDFLGINYYTRSVTRHDPSALPARASAVLQSGHRYTAMDWEVWPEALTQVLTWVRDRYGSIPLYVTENGAAFPDPPEAPAEGIDDRERTEYLRDHLVAVHRALEAGVDVRGYFVWSLLDNFEWSAGYSKRFGIVHVDFATQRRTIKASGRYYAEVLRDRAVRS